MSNRTTEPDGESDRKVSGSRRPKTTSRGSLQDRLTESSNSRAIRHSLAKQNAPWLLLAVDECVRTLEWFGQSFKIDETIRDLLNQASEVVLEGADQVLTHGMKGAASSGRTLIEIEFLLRDFALDYRRVNEWANSDRSQRIKKFSFSEIRTRLQKAAGVRDGLMFPDRAEFAAHSEGVHVAPSRAATPPDPLTEVFLGISDLLEHSRRLILSLYALAETAEYQLQDDAEDPPEMPAMQEALAQMNAYSAAVGMPARGLISKGWEARLADAVRTHPRGARPVDDPNLGGSAPDRR